MIPDPAGGHSTETGELLQSAYALVENVRTVAAIVGLGFLLVMGGAYLERWLLKQRLQVLDGEVLDGDRR